MLTRLLFAALLGIAASPAQESPPNRQAEHLSSLNTDLTIEDYRLGAGDLLEITVFGVADLTQVTRVSSSGFITLPFLGKVRVEDMSASQLETDLIARIEEQKLIRDPQVTVFVKEYRSQPVYVLGAVNQPGQYMVTHQLRLLDLITMAGGMDTKRSGDCILLKRKSPGRPASGEAGATGGETGTDAQPVQINIKKLLESGDVTLNVPVRGGDIIQVPERKIEVFYVVGEVGRAGAFELPKEGEREVLATQALALAGGPMKTAKMGSGVLIRYNAGGQPQREKVDFSAIIKGKRPDFTLRPNDIIFVPGSNMKTLGYGLLGVVPGTVSGAIIWGGIF